MCSAKRGGVLFLKSTTVDGTLHNASVHVLGSTFTHNRAEAGGVIFLSQASQITLTEQTLLEENEALYLGGALHVEDEAVLYVTNSILQNNYVAFSRGYGGAIFAREVATIVMNNTLLRVRELTWIRSGHEMILCR